METSVKDKIESALKNNKVMVYMKGTPDMPQCGFSKTVVDILTLHDVTYGAVNVLEDPEMRQGIKDYTDWPTIPQVFVNGEFVGGCDIVLEMHNNGELDKLLKADVN